MYALIDRARTECQNHWFTYDERMTVESVAQAVSNLAIQFGDSDDDGGAAMVIIILDFCCNTLYFEYGEMLDATMFTLAYSVCLTDQF